MRLLLALVVLLSVLQVSAFAEDAAHGPTSQPTATTAPPLQLEVENDPSGTVSKVVASARSGDYRMLAALMLAVAMAVVSRVRDKIAFFKGDRGGAILVMVLALAGGLTTSLATKQPIDLKLLLGVLGVAWTACGGYTWVKRLIWPADAA